MLCRNHLPERGFLLPIHADHYLSDSHLSSILHVTRCRESWIMTWKLQIIGDHWAFHIYKTHHWDLEETMNLLARVRSRKSCKLIHHFVTVNVWNDFCASIDQDEDDESISTMKQKSCSTMCDWAHRTNKNPHSLDEANMESSHRCHESKWFAICFIVVSNNHSLFYSMICFA